MPNKQPIFPKHHFIYATLTPKKLRKILLTTISKKNIQMMQIIQPYMMKSMTKSLIMMTMTMTSQN